MKLAGVNLGWLYVQRAHARRARFLWRRGASTKIVRAHVAERSPASTAYWWKYFTTVGSPPARPQETCTAAAAVDIRSYVMSV